MTTLLRDRSPLSIGSAVVAFESVCPTRLDLLHQQYRRLCRILIDVDEWGQVYLLNLLLRYARTMLPKPTVSQHGESIEEELDADLQLLLASSEPLFQSKNPAVGLPFIPVAISLAHKSLGSARCCARLLLYRSSVIYQQNCEPLTSHYARIARSRTCGPCVFIDYHTCTSGEYSYLILRT